MGLLAVCLTTVALIVLCVVPHARATSDQESVTGHAQFVNALGNHIRFSISAVRHRDGTVSGEGEEHAETPAGDFIRRGHATVVCFTVAGNVARIGFVVDTSRGAGSPPGTEGFLTVVDNGEGGDAPADLASVPIAGPPGAAQAHCDVGFARPLFPIDSGNIQVRPSGF
jgi:hypothetical protein